MAQEHTAGSLARLPGRRYDPSARELRESFLAGEVDLDQFLRDNAYRFPRTSETRFQNRVQTYATASLVIDQFWKYLQTEPVAAVMLTFRREFVSASYDERVICFTRYCNAVIGMLQNRFIDQGRERHKKDERSHEDDTRTCFYAVALKGHPEIKGLPFPSMMDLVTLLARMARVAPLVFERDIGRQPDREELIALLRQPNMLRFFVELMSNDRKSVHPLFALLEGKARPNLNDYTGTFDPQYFAIFEKDEAKTLQLQPAVIQDFHRRHIKAAKRRVRRRQQSRPVLGCPALYTGTIRAQYDWTLQLLERWM